MSLIMCFNIYSFLISLPLLVSSNIMIFFSSSWFSQWMIMEINLIAFLSLIVFEKKSSIIYIMEYYLFQSILSFMFLFLSNHLYFMNGLNLNFLIFMIYMIMFTKIGMPPLFFWYFNFCKNLNWNVLFIMLTFQKVIPLFIMLNLSNLLVLNNLLTMILLMILIIFSFICSILSLNVSNLKLLMAYSSVIQMSWLLILMFLNEVYFLLYFFIYFIILSILIKVFHKFNFLELNSLLNLFYLKEKIFPLLMLLCLISLAGIPPFFGFLIKWISLFIISDYFSYYMMILMILNSLISMFFYLRVMFFSFFFSNYSFKLNYFMELFMKFNFSDYFVIFIIMNIFGLMIYEIF